MGEFLLTGPRTLFALILSFIPSWRKLHRLYTLHGEKTFVLRTTEKGYDGIVRTCKTFRDRMLAMGPREISLSWPRGNAFLNPIDAGRHKCPEWDVRVTHLVLKDLLYPTDRFVNLRELVVHKWYDYVHDEEFDKLAQFPFLEKLYISFIKRYRPEKAHTLKALPHLKELCLVGALFFDLRSIATSFPSLRKLELPYFAFNGTVRREWNHVGIDKDLGMLSFPIADIGYFVFGETMDKETGLLRPVRVSTINLTSDRPRLLNPPVTGKGIVHAEKIIVDRHAMPDCIVTNEIHMISAHFFFASIRKSAFLSFVLELAEKKCKLHIHLDPAFCLYPPYGNTHIYCTVEEMRIVQDTVTLGVRKSLTLRNPSRCSLLVVDYHIDESEGCVVLMAGMMILQETALSAQVLAEAAAENARLVAYEAEEEEDTDEEDDD
jgi:hypothetical protein